MTVLVRPTVEIYFNLSDIGEGDYFILDDPVKGKLDDATYVLADADGEPIDVSEYCYRIDFDRGRNRELDAIDAGTCTVGLRNYGAEWLPLGINDSRLYEDDGVTLLTDDDDNQLFDDTGVFEGQVDIGRRVRVSVVGQVVFDGVIDDWDYKYRADGLVDAQFVAVDALARLARQSFSEWATTASQLPGARIEAALNRSEIGFPAIRDIDDGADTLQGDTVTYGTNALNYLQLVAQTDFGSLFVSRQGVLTFRDRRNLAAPTSLLSFTDDGTGASFTDIELATSSELLYTRVTVEREGGVAQTAENATSVVSYGIRTLDRTGLLFESDPQSIELANWLTGVYSTPTNRIKSIGVLLESLTDTQRGIVAGLELGNAVTVVYTPRSVADPVTQLMVVEGISHSAEVDGLYRVRLQLSPSAQLTVFVLDDDTYGALDGADNALAY